MEQCTGCIQPYRYFNSWIETYSDSRNDLKNQKTSSSEEETSSEEDYDEEEEEDYDDIDEEDDDNEEQFLDSSTDRKGTLSRSSSHDSFITFEASHELDDDHGLSTLDDTFTASDDPLAFIDSDLAKTKLLEYSDCNTYFSLYFTAWTLLMLSYSKTQPLAHKKL